MKSLCTRGILFFIAFAFAATASAYTTYQASQGPLKLFFGEPGAVMKLGTVTELNKPQTIKATFENLSETELQLELTFRTIETIEFSDSEPESRDTVKQSLKLAAKQTKTTEVKIVALEGTYSAHYPIHLDAEWTQNGKTEKTNIVLVLETTVPSTGTPKNPLLGKKIENPAELPLNVLPNQGGLFLSTLDTYRGIWNYDNKPMHVLPVGYAGTDGTSSANIFRQNQACGGEFRQSLCMHPPYKGGVGNVGVEFRVKLSETKPITLSFFSAVRTVVPPETPSDGVTFRVSVDGEKIYEKHNAETVWVDNSADLSRFAGKAITLRLESDPGPKRNTNCDSCYWGDVMLYAGEKPVVLSTEDKQKLFDENLAAIKSGKTESPKTRVFKLEDGLTGAVTFGENGFIDGVIGVGNADKQLQFDGLKIWCKGQAVGAWPSSLNAGTWISEDAQNPDAPPKPAKKTSLKKSSHRKAPDIGPEAEQRFAQQIEVADRSGTLFFGVAKNGPALQFSIDASEIDLIDRIEFGPATHTANRVYYGHGYCISEPEAFTAGAGGHNLSTSHVGMDFENGISVLQATSFPPDRFVVDPKTKRYTLSVHPATTMTLLPGLSGAMDCAIRYRPICGKTAAPGVKTKAGRFVFDVWGGKYQEHVDTLKQAIRYGLTDSQFIVHNWQRWGYDNRLPDIWPPNTRWGTLEEMQEALKLCDEHGIQYGVHDNYIDFYPDADEYDFDVTTFHENGQPRKAWNNYGIEAQSYQFRPDKVQKFLERNLDLMLPKLPMSTYFVDVFTSIPPIDYFDRDGVFHSRTESQACWHRAFDTIRDRLSHANKKFPSATTSSEAGMDSLIGHLDGADCQFMFLSSESGEFRIPVKCKQWSRVPWFDAVHHTTFSQHGVGYSGRYEAQRGRAVHGIESDDYISAEILTGHALMVDWSSARRGAVRKYWLAQDLIRHLADKEIIKVEFVDDNIDRQIVTWSDGTQVRVNLGDTDWTIKPEETKDKRTFVLPQYGYFTVFRDGASGIWKQDGRVVEAVEFMDRDAETAGLYVNARQKGGEHLTPLSPSLNSFEYLGDNRFSADFAWDVKDKVSKDLCIFVHCAEKRRNWHHKIKDATLGGGYPKTPTSKWNGKIVSDKFTMAVPDDLPAGKYYLLVGLYDQKGDGRRAGLVGFNTGADRYAVGWIKVERNKDGKVTNIAREPLEWNEADLYERLLPPKEPVDFGICTTKGAFRIELDSKAKTATVTPLPEEPATEIALKLRAKTVRAIDADGKELRDVPFEMDDDRVVFTTRPDEFAYRIVW